MKPTQAQIEAAAVAIRDQFNRSAPLIAYIDVGKAALTAAAEAGDPIFELDAKAAEIAKTHIQDVIERCAQVALSARFPSNEAVEIAAAIRALKK